MIATVLAELGASAAAQIPGMIQQVATIRGVELESTIEVYDWWMSDAQFLTATFPALFLTWDGTSASRRKPVGRKAKHRIGVGYAVRSTDTDYVRRQLTYVPEALLAWIDDFPVASREEGPNTKSAVAIPDNETEIAVDATALKDGSLVWAVEFGPFTITAADAAAKLPTRPVTHPAP
jgi:hypothetical protein